jgi:UDP-N-acetylenolpyruvoylglucosamine reductase
VTRLADYTTLGLGGPAKSFVTAAAAAELIDAVRSADASGEQVLLIGGGSNLVIADEGFPGTAIHVNSRGIGYTPAPGGNGGEAPHTVHATVAAGEDWDCPASPAGPAPPRSRTSAPTATRWPRSSLRCGCTTAKKTRSGL